MHHQFDIHDEREQNKIGLETYFLDKTNMFFAVMKGAKIKRRNWALLGCYSTKKFYTQ